MNNNEPVDVILHGEAMIFKSKLSSTAKHLEPSNKEYHIIADSETTGNHHVVNANEGVEFFMDDDGVMFMVAEKPTAVRCLHENRHSTVEIAPGTYEFGIQEEYDNYAEQKRKVRD